MSVKSRYARHLAVALMIVSSLGQACLAVDVDSPAALLATYASSTERLRNSPFKRPLWLESEESKQALRGNVYALIDQPISALAGQLSRPQNWCDALLLHPNVALCRASTNVTGSSLMLDLGSKLDTAPGASYSVVFAFKVKQNSSGHFEAQMGAEKGPLGTRDYRILLAAVPVSAGKTFIHLSYSYTYGSSARLAARAYLATKGRNKVGFTVVGRQADGAPKYMDGLRGTIERNAMRYYLAIDAFLSAKGPSGSAHFEQSLKQWFDSTEQYPRQLKDNERADYLSAKWLQYQRQNGAP